MCCELLIRDTGGCDVSLVLVAHRSSPLLARALAAFRRETQASGLAGETIVVEQSEDSAEEERTRAVRPDRLLVRENRGYAAGLNAGIAEARGRFLLLGNPDVELGRGALGALVGALGAGWSVAGPQFELARTLFPPSDEQAPRAELARRRACRSRAAWSRHMTRELRRWRRVWEATAPVEVPALSGALLATSAEQAHRLGPWPEDYFLYFEETEWLGRARRLGARLAVVPAARAVHRWGHAADPAVFAQRFDASQERFYRRAHPLLGRLALNVNAAPPAPPAAWPGRAATGAGRWLLSPSPAGFPAALVERDADVEQAATEFCASCGRDEVTLVGVEGDLHTSPRFTGPYVRSMPGGERQGAGATVRER